MSKNHSSEEKLIRLQKYIADCGVCSRRKAEELILAGQIRVNDKKVTELGTKVHPVDDVVMYNGEVIDIMGVDHVYVLLNKPRGCVTTVTDPEGRKTVMDYLKPVKTRVFPVGRLDYLSEGLLLFTNDGDLAQKIMHPKFEMVKTYEVKVFGRITDALLNKLRNGIQAQDGLLKPKSVRVIEQLPQKTWIEFRLAEGKNREIRRLCEAFDLTIDKLRRVAIGSLNIQGLPIGSWEYMSKADLLKHLGISKDGSKLSDEVAFLSPKKSVDLKKFSRIQKNSKLADDKAHTRYRKDVYHETLQIQQAAKIKREEEEKRLNKERVKVIPSYAKKKPSQSRYKK